MKLYKTQNIDECKRALDFKLVLCPTKEGKIHTRILTDMSLVSFFISEGYHFFVYPTQDFIDYPISRVIDNRVSSAIKEIKQLYPSSISFLKDQLIYTYIKNGGSK